ncbi:uncharacterized protein LOC111267802 isoform X4 [Varroa jacobsoni]|nr:uncharacterized protein LOC111246304 isoform X4 [Varroa destructor]XP_022651401.1 uncharacterized protein LOC111246304 isoform X4 [Varroa destructor]XP_022651402.1 uncharacterized protein LOC111246304 isoform X4 [Varroa destructor]XP_022702035.1 uncharacterized protein LOC111267802 isoform X4 [Varroa jacobsoni]XP_022702036.1 uncharacterized protein LOC111267802 isoform X4 [Varroa jacobsoni]XP_022702037.1 uncharacterized protein LOC111267802 isoform X4 [Varroa jacobsoni]XP_022702038.1 uncha
MQYTWLHKEEYLKRQVHVALALMSILAMMSACRITGAMQTLFLYSETSQTVPMVVRERGRFIATINTSSDRNCRVQNQSGNNPYSFLWESLLTMYDETPSILQEVAFTLLQGTLSSVGSPLLVFIVYSVAIGAQYGALSVEYRLEEHSSLNAVADLVITVNQATIISIIVASSLLHLLIVMTCALRLDPDILVVPLAGAAGHFTYLFFFVSIHEANSKVRLTLFICEIVFLAIYWMKGISGDNRFPFWELLPAAATSITLSTQYALIDSAVYEEYPKVNLLFSLTGFVAVIHASTISSSFRIATARCIPYTRPSLLTSTLFGDGPELERALLSIACIPGLGPLLMLHSYLCGTSLAVIPGILLICFATLWLPILLFVARWSNHLLRHIYGKHIRSGCCTIALLEFIQHLAQSIVYFTITGLLANFPETTHVIGRNLSTYDEKEMKDQRINITHSLLSSYQQSGHVTPNVLNML